MKTKRRKMLGMLAVILALIMSTTAMASDITEEPEAPEETHTHKYTCEITIQPTKTAYGEKTYSCECGDIYTEEIAPLKLSNVRISDVTVGEGQISFKLIPYDDAATGIRVYRTVDSGEREEIAVLPHEETVYVDTDVESGKVYRYLTQTFNEVSESNLGTTGGYRYLDTPELTYTHDEKGMHFSWNAVEGATTYTLQKKVNSQWKTVTSGNITSYTDVTLNYGEKATYRLYANAIDASYIKADECTVTSNKFGTPTGLKAKNIEFKEVEISWKPVAGAQGYKIYRATSKNGTYKEIDNLSSTTVKAWFDKNLKLNQTYYYKVAAYGGKTYHWCDTIVSVTPKMTVPIMENVHSCTSNSITIKWQEVANANGYYVYRKTTSGSWKKIATVNGKSKVTYKDSKIKGKYIYAVCAYRQEGKTTYTSNKSTQLTAAALASPTIKSIKQVGTSAKVNVTWNSVKYADEYRIYQRAGSKGSWKLCKTVDSSKTSYTATIKPGTTYYWRIKPAMNKNDKVYVIGAYSANKSYSFSAPKFEYDILTSCSKTKKRDTVKIKITNKGSQTLEICSTDAALYDGLEQSSKNDRNLKLVSSTGKKLSSVKLNKSKSSTLYLKVVGNTTKFYSESILQLKLKYDGLYYVFYVYGDESLPEIYYIK